MRLKYHANPLQTSTSIATMFNFVTVFLGDWLFLHESDEAKYMIKKVTAIVVLLMITSLSIAGCTSPTKTATSPTISVNATGNATTTSIRGASQSPTSTASPAAQATNTPSVQPTPTSTKIATSIRFANVPKVSKSFPTLGINVIANTSGILVCGHGTVAVLGPDGNAIGTVSSGGSSDCSSTVFLDASSLSAGTYNVTLRYSGDSTYQPSQRAAQMTVTP